MNGVNLKGGQFSLAFPMPRQFSLGLLMTVLTGLCIGIGLTAYTIPALLDLPLFAVIGVFGGSLVIFAALVALLIALRNRS